MSDTVQRRRWDRSSSLDGPPTQYPSKLLPDISNSPRPPDGSLVPAVRKSQNRLQGSYDLDGEDRVRQLEVRLTVAERSNRALLEEVLRLQGEIKGVSRRNDELIRDEKGARQELEAAISSNNELLANLSVRIKDAEHKLQEEKAALTSLVSHTKGVEHAVKSSQNELIAKKDVQGTKMQQMRIDLDEALQAKNQMERLSFQMADDIRTLKMKLDSHSAEFATVSNDLKNRAKKLEDDNRSQVDSLRKQNTIYSQSEQDQSHLRNQVETRLTELRDVLIETRTKQDSESTDRRNVEQTLTQRINELQTQISDYNRKREENAHSFDMLIREKDHAVQADRLTLMSKVSDNVEEVNKKLLTKEIKLREEMQDRYLALEKLIQQEQQQRREVERGTREEADRKWTAIRSVQDEQAKEIKELMKTEKGKTKDTLKKLDESISIIEKQLVENKKQVDKVMAAEISQRKTHEYTTADKIADVNEKLQIATSTLQQSIGAITQSMHTNSEKLRREVRGMIGDQKESTTRGMTDLDARVNFLKQRMGEFDEKLEARVATASQALSENLREKVESITMWQETAGQKLREVELTTQKLPDEIYGLQEKQTLLKSEVNSRMNAEADTRMRDIENLKQDVQTLKMRRDPKPATVQDLENVQASVRKLADSIQTVKTVLGMKIQSEQKLRTEEIQKLQEEIAILRTAIEPLVKKPLPRTFVKDPDRPDRRDAEENTPDVNKWGVDNAYRWLKWKSKLTYMLWQIRARKDKSRLSSRPSSFLGNTNRSRPSSAQSKNRISPIQGSSQTQSKNRKTPTQRPPSSQSVNRRTPDQRLPSSQSKKGQNSSQNIRDNDKAEQSESEPNWD